MNFDLLNHFPNGCYGKYIEVKDGYALSHSWVEMQIAKYRLVCSMQIKQGLS